MKRIFIFLFLALCLDRGLAVALSAIDRRVFTGDRVGGANAALKHDAEILILGSSRAEMHVNPKVLRDELSMTAYDAGLKGQDFLYSVMLFDLWKHRHPAPKAIVLTVDIESLIERPTEIATAHILAPHVDESELVREVLYSAGTFKPVLYLSHAYRFNGQLLSLLKHARGNFNPDDDGFKSGTGRLDPVADSGVLNALDQDATQMAYAKRPFSDQKLRYLREFVGWNREHGTRVFLLHTPLYRQDQAAHALWMGNLAKIVAEIRGVEIIDLCTASHAEIFADKPDLYLNLNHLNGRGAAILTGLLAGEIRSRIAKTD